MKAKKIIAVICLAMLCTQVIPLKQIGAMLFNNQITEEIAHTSDCGKKLPGEKESDHYLPAWEYYSSVLALSTSNHGIYASSVLVQLHFAEVQTPPPNLV